MARIMIMTDTDDGHAPVVLLEERVLPAHFESDHYSAQLVERVGWAILDADAKDSSASAQRA
jgi:hypothetical protein